MRRYLLGLCLSLLPLAAQSYQSSFTEVKYDRAKGPGTFTGGVEVDAATGAASVNIPLGPGIGARGLVYVPTLHGRWAPQVQGKLTIIEAPDHTNTQYVESYEATHSGGFTLTPGYLNWLYYFQDEGSIGRPDGQLLAASVRASSYQGPDGSTATFFPPEMTTPPDLPNDGPTGPQLQALIQTFGFTDPSWQAIGGAPLSGGELAVRLVHPTLAPYGNASWLIGSMSCPGSGTLVTYPTRWLVIKGDIAFEYGNTTPHFSGLSPQDSLGCQTRFLTHVASRLISMRNRLGDQITFDETPTGFKATWSINGVATGSSIEFTGSQVIYSGDGPQPSYTLSGLAEAAPGAREGYVPPPSANEVYSLARAQGYSGFKDYKISTVTNGATGESIQFTYGVAGMGATVPYDALATMTLPGRQISLTWASYTYRNSQDWEWKGYLQNLYPTAAAFQNLTGPAWLPNSFSGVTQVVDFDTTSGAPQGFVSTAAQRITTHKRVVPVPDFTTDTGWKSTAHYDLITHPDGHMVLHRFAEPVNGTVGGPTSDFATQLKTLAALKHVLTEVREYASGNDFVTPNAPPPAPNTEYLNPPSATTAPKITSFDRFDLRSANNPLGSFYSNPIPSATRTRTWAHEVGSTTGTLTTEESLNWDVSARAWQRVAKRQEVSTTPAIAVDFTSLATQGVAPSDSTPTTGLKHQDDRSFQPNTGAWIFGQVATEQKTVLADTTEGKAAAAVLPFQTPLVNKTYDPRTPYFSRVTQITQGGIQTNFDYMGDALQQASQMRTATVVGPKPPHTGPWGAAYGYDATYGRMNQISPNGVSWSLQQNADSMGRVLSQKDANALVNTFTWDAASRLTSIVPPGGEVGTIYTPDSDNRGVTITRGVQKTKLRYNVFGNLVLEARFDGTNWSSKEYGYDAAGRKTGETIWRAGQGSENEWWKENLVQAANVLTGYDAGYWECIRYDSNGNCQGPKIWIPPDASYTPLPAITSGHATTYDSYGRVIQEVDPNGIVTAIAYTPFTKAVTVAPGTSVAATTYFISDAAGRLTRVVDAKNQVTTYGYDPVGKILEVRQYPTSTGTGAAAVGTGTPQVRSWVYDSLGRTVILDQPESNVTYYTAFNALGKPTRTVYGLPRTWRPASVDAEDATAYAMSGVKTVATEYDDPMGRLTSVISSDGTVNQTFTYDEAGRGLSNSKLTTVATAQGVSRQFTYGGLNGRPSALTRGVDGLTFSEGLTWNPDGTLASRTYPDGKVQTLAYDAPKGLPNGTGFNGSSLATMSYDPVFWGLTGLTYGNTASTFFQYDTDQTRLKKMTHMMGATTLKAWPYTYNSANQLTTDSEDYYTYDPLGRLTSAFVRDVGGSSSGIWQTFGYDLMDGTGKVTQSSFGNRTSLTSWKVSNWTAGAVPPTTPTTTSLAGDARNLLSYTMTPAEVVAMGTTNRLPATLGGVATGVGATGYDAQGNLLSTYRTLGQSGTAITLTYDALGRVSTMADTKNATTETYLHDDEGLRIKVTDSKTGKITYHVYNEARQLIASYEKVGTGALTWKKDIVYVGTKEVAEIDSANKTWVTFVDHLGSPRLIWNGTAPTGGKPDGVNLIEQKFMPFGESLIDPTTQMKFAKGFTNHEQTDPSGLIYMQARFYAPWFGRFLSPDPGSDQHFERTQKWNIYSYVSNNPTMNFDPNGMDEKPGFFRSYGAAFVGGFKAMGQAVRHPVVAAKAAYAHEQAISKMPMGAQFKARMDQALGSALPPGAWGTAKAAASLAQGDTAKAGSTLGSTHQQLVTDAALIAVGEGVSKGLGALTKPASGAIEEGTTVFRVFGENNKPLGQSWTTTDPLSVPNFRDAAGLPDVNTGRFVVEGTVTDTTGVTTRQALPLDGNKGGLPEVLIPNAEAQVKVKSVKGVNPEL